jgi:hypothetical protein
VTRRTKIGFWQPNNCATVVSERAPAGLFNPLNHLGFKILPSSTSSSTLSDSASALLDSPVCRRIVQRNSASAAEANPSQIDRQSSHRSNISSLQAL